MKFMFTIYHDENVLNAMPEKEMQALVDSAIEYAEGIRPERPLHRLGRSAAGPDGPDHPCPGRRARSPPPPAPLPRPRSSSVDSSLIEAKDMDEACAVAAKFPPARVAVIEVRPVQELKHSGDRTRFAELNPAAPHRLEKPSRRARRAAPPSLGRRPLLAGERDEVPVRAALALKPRRRLRGCEPRQGLSRAGRSAGVSPVAARPAYDPGPWESWTGRSR